MAYNSLCWLNSLLGNPEEAEDACVNAVMLARTPAQQAAFRDSRGLNSALLGNYEAAIVDFEAFVEFFQEQPEYASYVEKRRAWIAALRAGVNPFDADTLAELLHE